MSTYLLKGKSTGTEITLAYNKEGVLCSVEANEASSQQLLWLWDKLPKFEDYLKNLSEAFKHQITVSPKVADTSFKTFWQAYNYKVGKKAQAERLWESMSQANRIKAISYIQRYRQHCTLNNVAMAYPTTYLNQRYYDND